MKKKIFSHALRTGVFSSMLVLSLILFAACGGGDDDPPSGPTVDVPKTGDMPTIPAETPAVSTKDEAIALINAFNNTYLNWYYAVDELIDDKKSGDRNSPNRSWEFSDQKTSNATIQVTSKGAENQTGSYDKVGASGTMSVTSNTTAKLIADIGYYGSVTLISGSTFAENIDNSQKYTIKAISAEGSPSEYDMDSSEKTAYSFGLTATANGKGGKIILDASRKLSYNVTVNAQTKLPAPTISGSLKVYGADDAKEVYIQNIDDETKLNNALALIGYRR